MNDRVLHGRSARWLLAAALAPSLPGCPPETQCECAYTGTVIEIAEERTGDVARVTASGAGCSAAPHCVSDTTPCSVYVVDASAEGACHIEVQFTSGAAPVVEDVTYRQASGSCCTGLYPTDAEGQSVIVPPLDDAGSATDASTTGDGGDGG
jgi:hypothetical protein